MKHIHKETVLLGAVLVIAVGLFAGALMLGERLSSPVSGLCFGAAGILGGVAGSRLIMARVEWSWTPEERKEIERGERDERNVTIREKAAYSSWYWSLYLLWGAVAADPGDAGRAVCRPCIGGHRAALRFLHGQCRALVPADVTRPVPGGFRAGKRQEKTRKRMAYGAVSEEVPLSVGGDAVGGG